MTSLKHRSDGEYIEYAHKKEKEGFNYFCYSNGNEVILGKLGDGQGRIFRFNNGNFISKGALYTAYPLYGMKEEMLSEKEFINKCKIVNINERDINKIIHFKPKSITDFEGKIPEDTLIELFLGGACGEDINIEDLLH